MDDQKIVVITGCSSGIGLGTAVLLAKESGVKVIASMRNLEKKDSLEKAAGNTLNKSLFIRELDISKEDSIVRFVTNTIADEGKIDVLVNNAGTGQMGKFEDVSMEQMQALFQTNFFGSVRITQEVVTHMKKRKSGHIMFISSILGLRPLPFAEFYVASKFAIEGIVGSIAPILRCFNISVTSVQPGPVKTSINENMESSGHGQHPKESGSVEDETDTLMKKFSDNFFPLFWTHEETVLKVAEIVKDCIFQPKPPVRIQPGESVNKMAREVVIDPTGNQMTDQLVTFFK